jgi:sugar lactone lactonase YvrE
VSIRIVVTVVVALVALPAASGAARATQPKVRALSFPRAAVARAPWTATVSIVPGAKATVVATTPGGDVQVRLRPTRKRNVYTATLRFPVPARWTVAVRVGARTVRLGTVAVDTPRDPLIEEPFTIAGEAEGSLLVGQRSGAAVLRIAHGRASVVATGIGVLHVTSANGTAYATGTDGAVYRADGATLTKVSPALDASSVAVDAAGNMYVTVYVGWVKKIAPDGTVTTVAGDGTEGYSGDGGPATAARIFHPHSIVLAGNALYVSDTENRRLRKIDLATGIITTFGGDVGITVSLAAGPDGSIYSADVIRDGTGGGLTRTTPAGVTTRLVTGTDANGVAVTPDGSVYANLWQDRRIQHFDPATRRLEPVARG